MIQKKDPSILTFSHACSNQIIRLIEKGFIGNRIGILSKDCIKPIIENDFDTLILGCKHYPFLIEFIKQEISSNIWLIDPSETTARQAKDLLKKIQLINVSGGRSDTFFVIGDPFLFKEVATKLLGFSPGTFNKAVL